MTAIDLARLVGPLIELARAAATAALLHYGPNPIARRKQDGTPVTDADEDSEAVILAGLARLTPEIPVVSEEQHASGHLPFAAAEVPHRFWLVDPLDGTREFVARNGEFCINIGLVEKRYPIFGLLLAPISGTLWCSDGEGHAFQLAADGKRRPLHARLAPPTGMTVLSSRSHGDDAALDAFLGDYAGVVRRRLGSAQKFGLLAAGEADLYPRFGPTSEWDTCAGQAILEAAGGRVVTLAGDRLSYGKAGFRNPDFIASGASPPLSETARA